MTTRTYRDSLVTHGKVIFRPTLSRAVPPMNRYPGVSRCFDNPSVPADYWMEDGNGKESNRRRAIAQAVCRECPLRAMCLRWATDSRQDGIYGGTNTNQREKRRAEVEALIRIYESEGAWSATAICQ